MSRERLEQVKDIYRRSFPEMADYADKIPELLRDPIRHGYRSYLLIAEGTGARVDAFALMMHFPDSKCCLLDYIASRPGNRGGGVGGALYEATREYAQQLGAQALYLEVEPDDPRCAPKETIGPQCRKRIRFYEQYGARVIDGTQYHEPVGDPPTTAFLMYDPLGSKAPLRRDAARRAVGMILTQRFGHMASPAYVRRVVESFRDDPVKLMPPRGGADAVLSRPVDTTHIEPPFSLVFTPQHEIHHVRERGYFERPIRHEAIRESLEHSGLFSKVAASPQGDKPILAVHDADFVHYLREVCAILEKSRPVYPDAFPIRRADRRPKVLPEQAGYYCIDADTPLYKGAYVGARAAVDTALAAAQEILDGRKLAYAACRPPGHHAGPDYFGGFCYFNNAAIAAQSICTRAKTAILDIDFHHGNGTQDIFYERDDVLMISIHGHPDHAYPYFSGYENETGTGKGLRFNRNLPLPPGTEEPAYLDALERALGYIGKFRAEVLVLSIGFDILKGDPTGQFLLRPSVFRAIGKRLAQLGIPMLVVQEGGYNIRNIRRGVTEFFLGVQ